MMANKIRQTLVFVLSCCLILTAFGAASAKQIKSDIAGHWAEALIGQWAENGWIYGYGNGLYKPDQKISRGEWMAFVDRVFGTSAVAEAKEAVRSGAIPGYDDDSMYGNDPVTRQEAAVMMANLLHLADVSAAANRFTDADRIAAWSMGAVGALAEKSILSGYTDRTFRPDGIVTRAEAVSLLNRALDQQATVYAVGGTYGPATGQATVNGDVKITAHGVTLRNMVIQGNLLLAESIGEGDVFLNNVTVNGTTTVRGGGANSVHLRDTMLVTVIVNKLTGDIRIVAEGKTSVGQVTLQSGAKLDASASEGEQAAFGLVSLSELLPEGATVTLLGSFDEVEVFSQSVAIEVPQGAIRQLSASEQSSGVTLTLGKDARIAALILEAVMKVLGEGSIDKATIGEKAAGTTFEKAPAQQEGSGSATPSPAASTGSGGSGGGSSGGGTSDTAPPTLSGVSAGTVTGDVYGTSSENGTLYLVPKGTAKELSHLTNMSALPSGNRATATAGQSATIDTSKLPAGTYVLYAVDASHNISTVSADIELAFAVSSSAYADGSPIPAKYSVDGGNTSIPLTWRHAPSGTQSFMVLMYDEHPDAYDFIHWHVINIPAHVNAIVENASRKDAMPTGSTELHHYFGDHLAQGARGYGGPQPPPGLDPETGTHLYRTVVLALADTLDANDDQLNPDNAYMAMTVSQLREYLGGRILAEAAWTGTFFTPAAPMLDEDDWSFIGDEENEVSRIDYDLPDNSKLVYAFWEWAPPLPQAGKPIPGYEWLPDVFKDYDDNTGISWAEAEEHQFFTLYVVDGNGNVIAFTLIERQVEVS